MPAKRSVHSAVRTVSMLETAALGELVEATGGAAAGLLPDLLGDVVRTLSKDAGALVSLEPSFNGLVRLGVSSSA